MKRPTEVPKSNPLKTTKASFWTGWTKPLQDVVHTLEADLVSLHARLKAPIMNGRPAAYVGFRDFVPETSIVQVDTAQTNQGTNPCNYVVRDGQDYDIPIIMPGPGVFVAHEMTVAIFQQQAVPTLVEAVPNANPFLPPVQTYSNLVPMNAEMAPNMLPFSPAVYCFTTKFSVYPQQTVIRTPGQAYGQAGNSLTVQLPQAQRTLNFFWNMIDTKSQRRLADAYISQMVFTPRSLPLQDTYGVVDIAAYSPVPDGDLFRFPTPWVFERDGQANFTFRPITPVFQFDSSIAGTDPVMGLPYDDRINGKRDQRVRVQIEIHGYRYETDQDAIRAGALSR